MLKQNTIFGTLDKEKQAIDWLKKHDKGNYHLAFSGGKDSIVIYKLAELAGIKFESVYNDTTIDPPELRSFIKKYYPQVKINRPKVSFFKRVMEIGPPTPARRWCCREYKEKNPKNATVITGIRHEESARRTTRSYFEKSKLRKSDFYLHPIINWTMLDVWEFIEKHELPYCSLYDEGFDRIGCILCPLPESRTLQIARWPKMVRAWKRAMKIFYDTKLNTPADPAWETFESYWNRWLFRRSKATNKNQMQLFTT